MITNGVTDNGVYYVQDGDTFFCSYYYGEGVEIHKTYVGVSLSFIEKLTFEDLKEV